MPVPQTMNEIKINQILQEFAVQPLGIQGVVLVSEEGQPITNSIGITDDLALIMAGTMLQLAQRTREEFQWQEIQQISIRAEEGYLTLVSCEKDIFLLVKTTKSPSGFLEKDIKLIIKKLQQELQSNQAAQERIELKKTNEIAKINQDSQTTNVYRKITKTPTIPTTSTTKLDPDFRQNCQQELAELIGPIASLICQRILNQNPQISRREFLEALAQQIPDQKKAVEFRNRLFY